MKNYDLANHLKLRSSWIWDGTVSDYVIKWIDGLENVLNVPCGASKIGNVLADINPIDEKIEKVDMNDLPWEDNTFDAVIQDPPWKIGFYNRMKPFFECVRVCKIGGIIIYNAYWIPSTKIKGLLTIKDIVIRQDKPFTNTSIITILEKN